MVNQNYAISPLPFYCSSFDPETIKESLQGIAFVDGNIILDSLGLEMYKKKNGIERLLSDQFDEGRFLALIKNTDESFTCKTDAFGQELLFYYWDGTNWAISTSLIYLIEKLRGQGVALDLYEPSLQSFMIGNQSLFGGQLLSHNTPVKQIKLLPYNKQIKLNKSDNTNTFMVLDRPTSQSKVRTLSDYEQLLGKYIYEWQSRLRALSRVNFLGRTLELSGGYDSRVNLSLLYRLKDELDKFNVFTSRSKISDFEAAKKLCDELGIQLNSGNVPRLTGPNRSSVAQEYIIWRYSSAGVYSPMYQMRSPQHNDYLKIHGANYRGRAYVTQAAEKRIDSLTKKLPGRLALLIKNEFLSSFDELGVGVDEHAIHEHYLAFRARIHYGRNWHWRFRNLFVTPQLSPDLKALTDWSSRNGNHPEQVTSDILTASDPKFASLPYDLPEKALPEDVLQKSKQLNLRAHVKSSNGINFYGEMDQPKALEGNEAGKEDGSDFRRHVFDKFKDASKNNDVKAIYGRKFISEAKKERDEKSLLNTGKLNTVLAAHEIIKLIK